MTVPIDPRVQPLIIRQPFFTKWIIRLTFVLIGLALLAASGWSLLEVNKAEMFKGAVSIRTWVYTALAVLGLLIGLWCVFIRPWRRSRLAWRADSNGIHVSRGTKPLRKINWSDVDSISSRSGFGHGGVIWMNGMKKKVILPFVKRKALVELIATWKRFT